MTKTVEICTHWGECGGECYRCRLRAAVNELATYKELLEAVEQMRHDQREYFRTRDPRALCASKNAERRVDEILKHLSNPSLF